jgi:hypothetical protein
VGYAHSGQGAVSALVNYSVVLSQLVLKPPHERAAELSLLGSPGLVRSLGPRLDRAAAQAAQTELGRGLRAGTPTVYLGASLGYRMLAYAPQRAVVQTWSLGVVANTAGLGPTARFQTSTSALVWRQGDWKLDSFASRPGPTPAVPAPASDAGAFVGLLARLRELRYAP